MYGSAVDFLGVFGIEPTRIYDTLNVKWGNMNEFVVKGDKIVSLKKCIMVNSIKIFKYIFIIFRLVHLMNQQMSQHG